jgi:hypothetical protein
MFQPDFFNPACLPIALMMMRFASWPERLVTVNVLRIRGGEFSSLDQTQFL